MATLSWGYRATVGDMKQTLPWSVAGIPPEAREAARAAASREGLSVGDWLTRRILGETAQLSEAEERREFESERSQAPLAPLRFARDEDTRRDREDLVARIARAEAETDSAFRRIDETLRTMTRRLETTERSQNEASRAMGTAAAEINAAARDQANAFSQLTERIDRVERHADSGPLKDAVRGLHQGLSRLADQIARTANESSTQVSSLASNVETIAGKIAETRDVADRQGQALEARMTTLAERVKVAEEASENTMKALRTALGLFESRLAASEPKSAEVERNRQYIHGLERTAEKIAQRLTAAEASAGATEHKMQETLDRHLSAIERTLDTIVQRLDVGEKQSRDTLGELRANLADTNKRIDGLASAAANPAPAPAAEPPAPERPAPERQMAAPILDMPPFSETPMPAFEPTPPLAPAPIVPPAAAAPIFPEATPTPPSFVPEPMDANVPPTAAVYAIPPAFEPAPPAFAPAAVLPFVPEPPAADPQPMPDYLAAARRAAQAAIDAEPQQATHGPLGSFRTWTESERGSGMTRMALIGAIVLLVIVAALAGILFTQGPGTGPSEAVSQQSQAVGLLFKPANQPPATANNAPAQSPAVRQSANEENTGGAALPARPLPREETPPQFFGSAAPSVENNTETASETAPPPSQQVTEGPPSAVETAPQANAPAAKVAALTPSETANNATPLARLTAKAKAGDAKAELLLGIKSLDGDGVAASDGEALNWFKQAANQGNALAQYRLGTMYERGRGIAADAKQAHDWYAASAHQGNRKAMHNLAVSFAQGAGVEKNFAEAAHWFTAAATLGLLDSQFNLAVLYERGLGVAPSLHDAYKWYAIAAAQGDAESKTRLDALATQITPADKLDAEKQAAGFRPLPMNRDANEAPDIAQVIQ